VPLSPFETKGETNEISRYVRDSVVGGKVTYADLMSDPVNGQRRTIVWDRQQVGKGARNVRHTVTAIRPTVVIDTWGRSAFHTSRFSLVCEYSPNHPNMVGATRYGLGSIILPFFTAGQGIEVPLPVDNRVWADVIFDNTAIENFLIHGI